MDRTPDKSRRLRLSFRVVELLRLLLWIAALGLLVRLLWRYLPSSERFWRFMESLAGAE